MAVHSRLLRSVFLVNTLQAGTRERSSDADEGLLDLAERLSTLQVIRAHGRPEANFHWQSERDVRAIEMVARAGGNIRCFVDALLSRLSWLEEEENISSFDGNPRWWQRVVVSEPTLLMRGLRTRGSYRRR